MKIKFETRSYNFVKGIIENSEMEEVINDFKKIFKEGEDIKYEDYLIFCMNWIDNISDIYYVNSDWNDEYEE